LGTFALSGTLIANSPLSAYTLHVTNTNNTALILDGKIFALSANGSSVVQNITCDNIVINKQFSVFASIVFNNDLGIGGNLSVSGDIINYKDVYLSNNTLFIASSSNTIGINTIEPNHALTVNGSVSASGNCFIDQELYVGSLFSVNSTETIITTPLGVQTSAYVTGNLNLSGDLTVANNTTLAKDLRVGPNTLFVNDTNARVGIRTGNPVAELTVNGEISASKQVTVGNILSVGKSTLYVLATSNKVGIGTTAPNVELTVVGEISATGSIYSSNNAFSVDPTTKRTLVHEISSSGNAIFSVNLSAGNTLFVDSVNKRVGVNTVAPNKDLTISGEISSTGSVYFSNNALFVESSSRQTNITGVLSGNSNTIFTTNLSAGNTLFVDSINKRVGVNTSTPNKDLTIKGELSATGSSFLGGNVLLIDSVNRRTTVFGELSSTGNTIFNTKLSAGNTLFVDDSSKRVGVNTNKPNTDLTVFGNISATNNVYGTFIFSTFNLHPTAVAMSGLFTSLTSVTASDDFIVLDLNGKRRALRVWDF
jgi:uncharacterized secreted protein with C-terminal beta-propeller domain